MIKRIIKSTLLFNIRFIADYAHIKGLDTSDITIKNMDCLVKELGFKLGEKYKLVHRNFCEHTLSIIDMQ